LLIRCDRCSTLYELDDTLLAAEGSPVQCTRCEHVFTARPPGARPPESADDASDETLVEPTPRTAPQAPPQRTVPPPPVDEDDDVPDLPPSSSGNAAPGSVRQPAPPQRWDRPGPPVYRPGGTSSASPAVTRPPQIRRDAVGAFEARLRRNARWRWLGPIIVLLVLAAVAAAWLLFSRRQGPVTERLRTEGLALVALDDSASLEQAVARFDEALRDAPKRREAEADRALAQVLRATALLEDGEALGARAAAALAAEQAARASAEASAEGTTSPAASPAPSPQLARLQAEARTRTARGKELAGAARQALEKLEADKVAVLEVARALAVQHAAAGEREAAQRQLKTGRAESADDAWLGLAEATLDVRALDRAGREHGVAELSTLATRHPELLRARYLLAAAQASLGRRSEAQAALESILAANPRHERAEALRAELARPPAAPPRPAAANAAVGNGVTSTRNAASQPPTPRTATPPGGAPAPSGTSPVAAARVKRAELPAGADSAAPPGPSAPAGAVQGSTGAPAAARAAPPRPRPRALPEADPVEFGAGR
jgi:predicted Zn finger-like uncharacterized protein